MDQTDLAYYLLDLVGLQMSDEMDRRSVVGILGLLLGQLLHPVFPAAVHPGANRLPDSIGIVHFGGGAQEDIFGIPTGCNGGTGHFVFDSGDVFGN